MDGSADRLSALLTLMQLLDSSFPAGTFAHSYGLEQAVRDGYVRDAAGVEAFVSALLSLQVATSDARALARGHRAAVIGDLRSVAEVDHALFATKGAAELRRASTATGRRTLQEVAAHAEGHAGLVVAHLEAVEAGTVPGTHPVALAVVGAAFDIPALDLVAGLLSSTANTLHQASMRLLPVSHRDVQAALHRARSTIATLARQAITSADEPLSTFHPVQEVASMRHETAAIRFFAS